MKKKFIALLATIIIAATMAVPAYAVTPRYQPVSTQSWYQSLQTALKSIKVTAPQGALDAAAKAGAEAAKDIDIDIDIN